MESLYLFPLYCTVFSQKLSLLLKKVDPSYEFLIWPAQSALFCKQSREGDPYSKRTVKAK